MAVPLSVNFSQLAATIKAWTDTGDEADQVGKSLKDGVPDLFVTFGGDRYAEEVVPNLQPAVDGSISLLESVKGQCHGMSRGMAVSGGEFANADNKNTDLIPPAETHHPVV
jgi:hypothetical protein